MYLFCICSQILSSPLLVFFINANFGLINFGLINIVLLLGRFPGNYAPANELHFVMLLVSQVCSEDGMEFTLRTPEGFIGRIYTYGYYDRCFFRGNGGTVNVLRISGPQGYPECGTQRVRMAISG